MFLSVATTHRPATDLGFLLHKHPERVHETDLSYGKAWLFTPVYTRENGAPDTIRTCDLCLRRATLYPAELRVLRGPT